MNVLIPLLITTFAGLSTVIGALVIFLKLEPDRINKFISFCLSFAIGVMLTISVIELIPESLLVLLKTYPFIQAIFIGMLSFILGFMLIYFLNKKLHTIEESSGLYKLGILSMLALMLHNFPEGIATFMASYKDIGLGLNLGLAIMLHNIPEGICIAVPIYYATSNKKQAISKTFISGLAEPLGAFLAWIFLSRFITDSFISIVLIFVAGIMITLSINEIFPKVQEYNEKKTAFIGFICGSLLMIVNHLVF